MTGWICSHILLQGYMHACITGMAKRDVPLGGVCGHGCASHVHVLPPLWCGTCFQHERNALIRCVWKSVVVAMDSLWVGLSRVHQQATCYTGRWGTGAMQAGMPCGAIDVVSM